MKKFFAVILILMLLLCGCGSAPAETTESSLPDPEPEENIVKLYEDPEAYVDHYFELTGVVFNVIGREDGMLVFQMNEDILNFENNTMVYTMSEIEPEVGDRVRITGYAKGIEEYENIEGQQDQAVLILADSAEIIEPGHTHTN